MAKEDDDDDDVHNYAAAAGISFEPTIEEPRPPVTPPVLREQLASLRSLHRPACSSYEVPEPPPTVASDDDSPHLMRTYVYDPGMLCSTLAVVFGGLAQGIGGIAKHEFMGAMAQAGSEHTLFVKDTKQAWYLLGLRTGESSFDGVVAVVRAECELLRPRRLVCIGASMGGYAAVRAGLELQADSILAFAPQVFIDSAVRTYLRLPYMRFDAQLEALGRVCKPGATRALTDVLEAAIEDHSLLSQSQLAAPLPLPPTDATSAADTADSISITTAATSWGLFQRAHTHRAARGVAGGRRRT